MASAMKGVTKVCAVQSFIQLLLCFLSQLLLTGYGTYERSDEYACNPKDHDGVREAGGFRSQSLPVSRDGDILEVSSCPVSSDTPTPSLQSEIMDMKQEMMDDTVDDVLGDEEDDEERYGNAFHGCLPCM